MSDNVISKHKFVEFLYSISGIDGNILEQIEIPIHYSHEAGNDMFPNIEDALNGCARRSCSGVDGV